MHARNLSTKRISFVSFFVAIVATGFSFVGVAHASPDGDPVKALLGRMTTKGTGEERLRAAAELAAIGADNIAGLHEFLQRKRASSFSERRDVLRAINADVPDGKGRFRSSDKTNSGDDFDWLAELAKRGGDRLGYGEVFADVAAIRALAASQRSDAAEAILTFAFSDNGLVYRDECGRYLRKMSPYSLPALIMAARDDERQRSLRRYAGYQLDRMDRDDPNKALDHASDDTALLLETLAAYGQSKHREALPPLFRYADHASSEVRDAARAALLGYVTGPEPPEAPKRKLSLPGGKFTDEEQPLWLNYRDLANVQIRRQYEVVFEDSPPRRKSSADLVRAIFERMDQQRQALWSERYQSALALVEGQRWAEATALFDSILAVQPEHESRADMVRAYFEHGRALAAEKSYRAASEAYSKAHGLAPEGPLAQESLANHYANLGRALEAEGKDGSAAFRRARANKPAKSSTKDLDLLPSASEPPRHRWMLYAGLGGGAGALILMILGLALRRR